MKKFFAGMTMTAMLVSALGMTAFAEGQTVTVDNLQKVGAMEEQRGSHIIIKENAKDSWSDTIIFELKLPSNAKWNAKTRVNGNNAAQINGNSLKFAIKTDKKYQENVSIVPFFDIDRGTKAGDLIVSLSTDDLKIKPQDIAIAKVSDYGANMSSSYEKASKNAKTIPVEIVLSESIQDSLLDNNLYSLVFDNATVNPKSIKIEQKLGKDKLSVATAKDNYIEMKFEEKTKDINKYVIKLDITPNQNYVGDITAKFDGKGVDTIESIVAKVSQVLHIEERKVDDIKLGMQDQDLSDIVFAESTSAAIAKGNYTLKVSPEYKGLNFTNVKLSATGNINVSSVSAKDDKIQFTVRESSTIPSTLKFSDLKLSLDRFAFDGEYTLKLVEDSNPDVVLETLKLFTVNEKVMPDGIAFVLGSTDYTITENSNTQNKTMDVAPYSSNGRTMLPVRTVAETLDMNVEWNGEARTATLTSKDGRKILLTLGNKTMIVDGKEVKMDVAPETKGGRVFLPVSQIASTLNVKVDWNASTNTVTILK